MSLRRGKEIAQACHASMAFLTRPMVGLGREMAVIFKHPAAQEWINTSYAKVCLQVDTEDELMEIARQAEEKGLEVHVVTDSGLTEFNGVPTRTCLAIGPDWSDKIDEVTGHLKLY